MSSLMSQNDIGNMEALKEFHTEGYIFTKLLISYSSTLIGLVSGDNGHAHLDFNVVDI